MNNRYDVIIVGGGPAGLSAALVLGRCMRNVLICDNGNPRNTTVTHSWGYLTRNGTPPKDLLAIAHEELKAYETVSFHQTEITNAVCEDGFFRVTTHDGQELQSRKLLLATGVKDILPNVEGVNTFYGSYVHHCPYCHAYEVRHKPLVAYGKGRKAVGLSLSLKTWSQDVTLCTDGTKNLREEDYDLLNRNGVKINTLKMKRLEGAGDQLERIVFKDDSTIPCATMFFSTGIQQHAIITQQLNCDFTDKGVIRTDHLQKAATPGLYVAGDADVDMQQLIVAAAEGAKAGIAINMALQLDDRK